jgi:VCBS repeat-containing protein
MDSARNVGRVGALAVALGVGFAMTAHACPAWAEPGSAGSTTGQAGGADSAGASGGPAHSGPVGERKPVHAVTAATPATATAVTATSATTTAVTTKADPAASAAAASATATAVAAEPKAPSHRGATSTAATATAVPKQGATVPPSLPVSTPKPLTAVTPHTAVTDVKLEAKQAVSAATPVAVTSPPTIAGGTRPLAATTVTNQVGTTPVTAPAAPDPIRAFLALPAILSTAGALVQTVLTSFTTPAPGSPPNPPLLWALAAVVRREFFNAPVDVKYTVSKPDSSGNVTISLDQTDSGGNQLEYSATNGAKGAVALNADGHSFTYTPTAGQTGTDTVTITATDPSITHINGFAGLLNALSFGLLGDAGRTATANVSVTLNTPPTLKLTAGAPDANSGAVTVNAVVTDVDGDPLTLSVTQPGGATGTVATPTLVDAATGSYSIIYTPTDQARHIASSDTATAAQQSDSFTVSVDDGHGATVTQTVGVSISPENSAPQFSTVTSSTDTNGKVTGTVAFTDANHDTVTYTGTATTIKGAVVVNSDGSFTYTPTADERNVAAVIGATDTDQFTVSANDGHGGTGSTNVSVTILPAVIQSNPTPADIASDPEAALATSQSLIAADTAAYNTVQASIGKSITAYNSLVDPTVLQNSIQQIKAQTQAALTAQLAQIGLPTGLLPNPVTQLQSTIGPLTADQLTTLLNEQKANVNSQQALLESLTTAQNARAAIAAKTASAPVFDRVVYTVGADGALTGQVYFVDPQGKSMTIFGIGDTITPQFNQSGSGSFSFPAPSPADYTSAFSFNVEATDTSGNITETQITLSRLNSSEPATTTKQSQVLTAYSSVFSSLSSGVQSASASVDQLQAQRDQAQAQQDTTLAQQLDDQISVIQANLANVLTNLLAAQNSLSAGYAAGTFSNLPS